MQLEFIKPGKYLLAVSGGVDSMTLLDILRRNHKYEIEAAHLNHGIRGDADKDEALVRAYCKDHSVVLHTKELNLGSLASEDTARKARYDFFNELLASGEYDGLITAHHQDDILETALINMMRGTHWRGMVAMQSNKDVLRPLKNVSKDEIIDYAKKHNVPWREDSTNQDVEYLRNYIRHNILAQNPKAKKELGDIVARHEAIHDELRKLIQSVTQTVVSTDDAFIINRHNFIMLPHSIAQEVTRQLLETLKPRPEVNSNLIGRIVRFIKTSKPEKVLELGKSWTMQSGLKSIHIVKNL
jgi:tRNA(Ile)-lysidine synthase